MGDVFDFASYLRFVAALAFVLGLILLAAHVAKRVLAGKAYMGARAQGRRLSVVEVLALDARHRAFLIRRDGKEHLIMTGPSGDLVVESGIEPDPKAMRSAEANVTPLHDSNGATQDHQSPLQKIVGLFGDRRA